MGLFKPCFWAKREQRTLLGMGGRRRRDADESGDEDVVDGATEEAYARGQWCIHDGDDDDHGNCFEIEAVKVQ